MGRIALLMLATLVWVSTVQAEPRPDNQEDHRGHWKEHIIKFILNGRWVEEDDDDNRPGFGGGFRPGDRDRKRVPNVYEFSNVDISDSDAYGDSKDFTPDLDFVAHLNFQHTGPLRRWGMNGGRDRLNRRFDEGAKVRSFGSAIYEPNSKTLTAVEILPSERVDFVVRTISLKLSFPQFGQDRNQWKKTDGITLRGNQVDRFRGARPLNLKKVQSWDPIDRNDDNSNLPPLPPELNDDEPGRPGPGGPGPGPGNPNRPGGNNGPRPRPGGNN